MAVAAGDAAILIVDAEFGALIAADLATPINSFPLGVRMYARASCSTPFHVPSAVWIRYDVVGLRPFAHELCSVKLARHTLYLYSEHACTVAIRQSSL